MQCLNPEYARQHPGTAKKMFAKIMESIAKHEIITDISTIELSNQQFSSFMGKLVDSSMTFNDDDRLDHFYQHCIVDMPELLRVIKMLMILPHGNAAVSFNYCNFYIVLV